MDKDLTLGIGEGQVSELSDLRSLHRDLARFLLSIPTGIVKGWDKILGEEVVSHPGPRQEPLLSYPLNAIWNEDNGFERLVDFFSSDGLVNARMEQREFSRQMETQHNRLKSNFPPSRSGKYIASQADEFAQSQVLQWLVYDHSEFLESFRTDVSGLNFNVFYSVRLFAYVIFYKYYLGQRQPKRLSDFGDLFHLFSIPYCKAAVFERDLCNVLNQIKNKQEILENTKIYNIDFIHTIHNGSI